MKKSTKIGIIIFVVLLVAATAAAAIVQIGANAPLDPDKYVTLGQYKGVEIERVTPEEVTDEAVQQRIDSALAAHKEEKEVTGRPVQEGDILSIDYAGTIDGASFEGGSAEDQKCVVGEGGYIDGFEDGLVGANAGETVTLQLAFPDDYKKNAELSGKAVTFVVTVNSIKEEVLPEYNDAFVAEYYDCATIAEYEASVREKLAAENKSAADEKRLNAVWEAVVGNASFSGCPQRELETYTNNTINSYTYMAQNYYGVDLATFLSTLYGMTVDEFKVQAEADAKLMVEDLLVVKAIAKAESISVSDEEYEAGKLEYLANMGYDGEAAFRSAYGASFDEYYGEDYLTDSLLAVKVQDFVLSEAVEIDPAE